MTTMKQEMCSDREDDQTSKVLWGFPWRINGNGDLDSGKESWINGIGSTNWHGLLNSPLITHATTASADLTLPLSFSRFSDHQRLAPRLLAAAAPASPSLSPFISSESSCRSPLFGSPATPDAPNDGVAPTLSRFVLAATENHKVLRLWLAIGTVRSSSLFQFSREPSQGPAGLRFSSSPASLWPPSHPFSVKLSPTAVGFDFKVRFRSLFNEHIQIFRHISGLGEP
ncbi:hypothetical protein JCGZ_04152 [Jatropha curcas]|uniref:Uncharacterized protein n=1 Tax=Jatropha curcas TaxID=180498 RepID=A0A067KWW4_JATCU|nr:hypothetical protein JCGZ_04152 [Jatropha curcas]